jgi:hypothetical protein
VDFRRPFEFDLSLLFTVSLGAVEESLAPAYRMISFAF